MKAKCFFSFTPKHLRLFFRHRGEGSEGKKHDLIVYVRVRAYARNECVHAKKQRVHERNNVKDMSTGGRRNPKEGTPSSANCSVIKNQKLPSPFVFFSYAVAPISEIVFSTSELNSVHIITGIRTNMKNRLMNAYDKIMLRKRSIIETINDMLKNMALIVHTRHRSLSNFIVNLLAGMAAYCFLRYKTLHQYGI